MLAMVKWRLNAQHFKRNTAVGRRGIEKRVRLSQVLEGGRPQGVGAVVATMLKAIHAQLGGFGEPDRAHLGELLIFFKAAA
jgi:hypothetical protein